MNTLDFGISGQYNIRFSTSPVFECALGIAAFTRDEIHDKLSQTADELHAMRDRMSDELNHEISLAGEIHTWRSLLFLAHRCPLLMSSPWEEHMGLFLQWIGDQEANLKDLAAPYLGEQYDTELHNALSGDVNAQENLIQLHMSNPVIHLNLRYLFSVKSSALAMHLQRLIGGWYKEILSDDSSDTMLALQRDVQHNEQLAKEMPPADLIRTVTKGSELNSYPGVDTLWVVPQSAYRPFTIVNYLPRCIVYYYPVADEFLADESRQSQMNKVALLHKAVGDVQRIRLLDLIRTSPKSLAELTNALNATKSNVHHHLALLRTAGFVRVEGGIYSLEPEALVQLGDELRTLLKL